MTGARPRWSLGDGGWAGDRPSGRVPITPQTPGKRVVTRVPTLMDATTPPDLLNWAGNPLKPAENGGKSGPSSLPSSAPEEATIMVTKATTTKKKALRRNIGEIIQRGQIWYIRYYDGRGRRRLESTHSTDREDAEKLLRKRLSAKDAGVLPEAAAGKLTLKDATDDLLNDYKVNGRRSLPEVRRKVELHLLPYFGERRRMTSITTAEMRAFVAERQREEKDDNGKVTKRAASNAEINRELAALRRAFRLAVRAGRLVQCPHVPMLQERNTRRGFLESDQIAAIGAALPEEVRPVVKFAYATGWRTSSEVLPLEWRNIDWEGRCVRLDAHTTKNGEARSFPFTADIETILKGQLAEHERLKTAGTICPFVFHRNGERIVTFRTAWKNACKTAGCPGKLIHDMRRSAVRTFERAGVPRSVAMSIVGHKTESIYRRYAIVDEVMQREAAARLDAWLAPPPLPSGIVAPMRKAKQ
jgi:integrase